MKLHQTSFKGAGIAGAVAVTVLSLLASGCASSSMPVVASAIATPFATQAPASTPEPAPDPEPSSTALPVPTSTVEPVPSPTAVATVAPTPMPPAPAKAQATTASDLLTYCSAAQDLFEAYEAIRLFESMDREAVLEIWGQLQGPLLTARAVAPPEIVPSLSSEGLLLLQLTEVLRDSPVAEVDLGAQYLILSTPGSALYEIQLYNFDNCGVGRDPSLDPGVENSGPEAPAVEFLVAFSETAGLACDAVAPDFDVAAVSRTMNAYCLGPAAITQAEVTDWSTRPGAIFLELSPAGQAGFEQVFATCFEKSVDCPVGTVAFVIDGVVEILFAGDTLPAGTELAFFIEGTATDVTAVAAGIGAGTVDFSLHPVLNDFS